MGIDFLKRLKNMGSCGESAEKSEFEFTFFKKSTCSQFRALQVPKTKWSGSAFLPSMVVVYNNFLYLISGTKKVPKINL